MYVSRVCVRVCCVKKKEQKKNMVSEVRKKKKVRQDIDMQSRLSFLLRGRGKNTSAQCGRLVSTFLLTLRTYTRFCSIPSSTNCLSPLYAFLALCSSFVCCDCPCQGVHSLASGVKESRCCPTLFFSSSTTAV